MSDTNLFSQQASNRRKSFWLVTAFVLFFAWLGLGGDLILWLATADAPAEAYHHRLPLAGGFLLLVAWGLVATIRKTGAAKVLWSTGATPLDVPATPEEKQLVNVVEEMAIAAGVPKPRIWLVQDADPNAFATGTTPETANIAVTTGLLTLLNRDELQGVIGHEIGHVKNLDTQLMTMVAGLVGAVALMSDGMGRLISNSFRIGSGGGGSRGGRGGGKDGGGGNPLVLLLIVLWLVSWLLAPIVTRLMALGISRKREYLADAMSAQFTRNPLALASALSKIETAGAPTKAIKSGAAHLCIADPLGRRSTNWEGFLGDLFATHPPMAMRVAKLKAMGFQALKASGDFQPT